MADGTAAAAMGRAAARDRRVADQGKKIAPYLGTNYIVESSLGHIRDLPRGAADVPAKYKGEPWARSAWTSTTSSSRSTSSPRRRRARSRS